MDCANGLPEKKHRNCVGDVSSRKLHAVSQFVRRNTLQQKLTGISVFSLVAFERNSEKSNSYCSSQTESTHCKHPPGDAKNLVPIVLHTRMICDKTPTPLQILLSRDLMN